uniref:Ig-like domain-containing protein n=1 Tax=Timema monikensis TaxID=170555 RepID=A0A7R9E919_9NEOP|nr:unnamed protein product [Timema monikensis]
MEWASFLCENGPFHSGLGSRGLKLLDMRVPQQAELNEATTLSCNFDLAGLKLYSVKWYKDDFEFFRYMPDNSPHSQALPVPGITVDLSASDMNTITLTHLGFNSSGSYRCEVSTESPNFMTVVASSNMTVRGAGFLKLMLVTTLADIPICACDKRLTGVHWSGMCAASTSLKRSCY